MTCLHHSNTTVKREMNAITRFRVFDLLYDSSLKAEIPVFIKKLYFYHVVGRDTLNFAVDAMMIYIVQLV